MKMKDILEMGLTSKQLKLAKDKKYYLQKKSGAFDIHATFKQSLAKLRNLLSRVKPEQIDFFNKYGEWHVKFTDPKLQQLYSATNKLFKKIDDDWDGGGLIGGVSVQSSKDNVDHIDWIEGINKQLQGIALGYKIYKALLRKVKWFFSNSWSSDEIKGTVYQKLIVDPDVLVIYTKKTVFLADKASILNNDKQLKYFIFEAYLESGMTVNMFIKNAIIDESILSKFGGVDNVKAFIIEEENGDTF